MFVLILFVSCLAPCCSHGFSTSPSETSLLRVPSYLQVGDLLFCDVKPGFITLMNKIEGFPLDVTEGYSNDHVALYMGRNRFVEATPYLYRPLRKNWLGVVTTPYWFLTTWATNITFGYVTNAFTEQKQDAVMWAREQRGSPYQIGGMNPNPNPYDTEDLFSDWWFCSELVWAAYYNQGVPLMISWGPYHFNASFVRGLRVADTVKMYTNIPPVADAGGPYEGVVNQSLYVEGFESIDVDGMIKEYYWEFGDGTNGTGWYTSHRYEHPGNYTLTLTVVDNADASDNDSTFVEIESL